MTVHDAFDPRNDPARRSEGRLFGKYRGLVTDNKDPLAIGRVKVTVPAVPGMAESWAMPCAPYAGDQVGFYAIPPVGAKVWVEFEGGDPSYPIWSGAFWQQPEVPEEVGTNDDDPSQVKVFKTRVATLTVDDTDQQGKVTLIFKDDSVSEPVTVTIQLDSTGLTITCEGSEGTATITMTPKEITTDSTTLSTTTSEGTTVEAQQEIKATAGTDMTLAASGGKLAMSGSSEATLSAPSVSVTADNSLSLSGNSATLSGNTSTTVSSSGTLSASGMTVTLSGQTSAAISGGGSLSLGAGSITFAPA